MLSKDRRNKYNIVLSIYNIFTYTTRGRFEGKAMR